MKISHRKREYMCINERDIQVAEIKKVEDLLEHLGST